MAPRRIYRKPPIHEAICEVRYAERPTNDLRKLSEFLSLLPPEYSGEITPAIELQPQVQTVGTGRATGLTLAVNSPSLQIWSQDKLRMITLGKESVSAHALQPYCGWENFKPHLLAAHHAFVRAYAPIGVVRIGVRYINRVLLPLTSLELSEYFVGLPSISMPLQLALSRVLSRVEGQLSNSKSQFAVTCASTESAPDTSAFMLDIDVSRSFPSVHENVVRQQIDEIRDEQRELFEASITDKTRALFDT